VEEGEAEGDLPIMWIEVELFGIRSSKGDGIFQFTEEFAICR
jgi:hypothetical protein